MSKETQNMTSETTKPRETVREFELRCLAARAEGRDYVETTDDIIKHFVRGGIPNDGYFIYQGTKVFLPGGYERWEVKEATPLDKRSAKWK